MIQVIDFKDELSRKAYDARDSGHLDKAAKLYTQLAQMGEIDAMVNLGTLLDDHIHPRNPQGAIYWYMKAVRDGGSNGAWNLAMHFIPCGNHRWYRFWMQKAADMGDDEAPAQLAKIAADPAYMQVPVEED